MNEPTPKPENLVICYQAVQRVYRNAVVKFLRERLTKEFGDLASAKVRSPFEKEWDKTRENAMLTRASGELGEGPADDFDLLGVNHFYNLFEAFYPLLFESSASADKAHQKQQKQAIQGVPLLLDGNRNDQHPSVGKAVHKHTHRAGPRSGSQSNCGVEQQVASRAAQLCLRR